VPSPFEALAATSHNRKSIKLRTQSMFMSWRQQSIINCQCARFVSLPALVVALISSLEREKHGIGNEMQLFKYTLTFFRGSTASDILEIADDEAHCWKLCYPISHGIRTIY